jgi:hypothetical protein
MNIRREIEVVNSMEVTMPNLSEAAVALFRLHVERMGQVEVDETNRDAYRELEQAGLMLLGRPFVGEPRYHLTRSGFDLKGELGARAKQSA